MNNQFEEYLSRIILEKKPQNVNELFTLIAEDKCIKFTREDYITCLIKLENENKLSFSSTKPSSNGCVWDFLFSYQSIWYWAILALSIVACFAIFLVTPNEPYFYIRWGLSVNFILFLPGYIAYRLIFYSKNNNTNRREHPDLTECIVLSVGISITMTICIGLFLNYTPWGLTVVPLTISLIALSVVLASLAMYVDYHHSFLLK